MKPGLTRRDLLINAVCGAILAGGTPTFYVSLITPVNPLNAIIDAFAEVTIMNYQFLSLTKGGLSKDRLVQEMKIQLALEGIQCS